MTNRPARSDDSALSSGEGSDVDPPAPAIPPDDTQAVGQALGGRVSPSARSTRPWLAAIASPDTEEGEGSWADGADMSPAVRDRPLMPPAPRRPRWGRCLVAVVAAVGLGYGALLAVWAAPTSDRERVADLAELAALDVRPLREADPHLADRLGVALEAVAAARGAPHAGARSYDPAGLDAAAIRLAGLVSEADPRTPVSQEGRLALGRVRLHQGRDAEAARVLGTLVRQGGYRAPEARRLLDFIRAVAE